MQAERDEARYAARAPAAHGRDAERADGGQEQQRDDAAPAHQVPDRSGGQDAVHAAASSGQPHVYAAVPSRRTSRAGRPASSSQATAFSPRTIAAVLAELASTQVPAATLTVRQTSAAGAPLRGSTMWCSSASPGAPAAHRGARGGEAAAGERDRLALGRGFAAVVVGDADRPAARGGGPGERDVAAEVDERARSGRLVHPRAHSDRRRAPSRWRPGRSRRPRGCGPCPRAVEPDALPAGGRDDAHARRLPAARDDDREVGIPAEGAEGAADGRIDVAVRAGRGVERDGERLEQQRAGRERRAGRAVEPRELGVVAEAAAGLVDPAQLVLHDREGRRQRLRRRPP